MSKYRAWLYKNGEARIFEGQDVVDAALAGGWSDNPNPPEVLPAVKKQGRPKGSKNKEKPE